MPLEQQGPFDIILHKLTDQMTRSSDGSQMTGKYMEAVQVLDGHSMIQHHVINLHAPKSWLL